MRKGLCYCPGALETPTLALFWIDLFPCDWKLSEPRKHVHLELNLLPQSRPGHLGTPELPVQMAYDHASYSGTIQVFGLDVPV